MKERLREKMEKKKKRKKEKNGEKGIKGKQGERRRMGGTYSSASFEEPVPPMFEIRSSSAQCVA